MDPVLFMPVRAEYNYQQVDLQRANNFRRMTILKKLSDRDSFIYEAILIVLKNTGPIPDIKLQFILLSCGVLVKKPLLEEALKKMKAEGILKESEQPPPQAKQKVMTPARPKIIMP